MIWIAWWIIGCAAYVNMRVWKANQRERALLLSFDIALREAFYDIESDGPILRMAKK